MLTRSFSAMLPARTRPAASRNGRGLPGLHLQSRPTRVSAEPTKVPAPTNATGLTLGTRVRPAGFPFDAGSFICSTQRSSTTAPAPPTQRPPGAYERSGPRARTEGPASTRPLVKVPSAVPQRARATTPDASGNRNVHRANERPGIPRPASRIGAEPPGKTRLRNVHYVGLLPDSPAGALSAAPASPSPPGARSRQLEARPSAPPGPGRPVGLTGLVLGPSLAA
jgi:hypothetical protein